MKNLPPSRVREAQERAAVDEAPDKLVYRATPTGALFHMDRISRVKALTGPVGTGKSVILWHDLVTKAAMQAPDKWGVRRTKWGIIRATYSQLRMSTIETVLMWADEHLEMVYNPQIKGTLRLSLGDGTQVEAILHFAAIDRPDQIANLLGLELTGAWINEVADIRDTKLITKVLTRCGRFPPKNAAPITWHGVIVDYNPPVLGSPLYQMFETQRPANWALYKMPPALLVVPDPDAPDDTSKATFIPNPEAENIQNLDLGYQYYLDIAESNRYDWPLIQRFVLGQYPATGGGLPVFPSFKFTQHVAEGLKPSRASKLIVSFDFGIYNAAVLGQYVDGQVRVIREFEAPDSSLFDFVENVVTPTLRSDFPGYDVVATGDPAGGQRSALNPDLANSIKVLQNAGFTFIRCPTNTFRARRDAVNWLLQRTDGFKVDKSCEHLVQALGGAYRWKTSLNNEPLEEPVKDKHSHIVDALQYLALYFRKGGELYSGLEAGDEFSIQQSGAWLQRGNSLPAGSHRGVKVTGRSGRFRFV